MSDLKLPYCSIQNPACGACGSETSHDGDSFYCEPCGLDYGDGSETRATYRDEDAEPCGHPCSNYWHGPDLITPGWSFLCVPCPLPASHDNGHWHDCTLVKTLNPDLSVAPDKGAES